MRYVHGIIQIQVREQVLPSVGGLAKPENLQHLPRIVATKTDFSRFSSTCIYWTTVPRKTHTFEMFMGL